MLIGVKIEEIEIFFHFVLILSSLMDIQEIKVVAEFMEYICRTMLCACVGAFLFLSNDQISERKYVILLFRLAFLAEFKEHWIFT
jgi:hypothetical protein